LTGSPGRLGQFVFKKNQNDVVLLKKQKSTGLQPDLERVSRVTPGFSFSRFFFNPAQFQPRVGRVPGRPAGLGQVSKLCYK
jgi:hypothetical protein